MDVWKSQSHAGKQTLLSVVCAIVGLILVIGFHNFNEAGPNAMAGFLLGGFLLLIGIAGFLWSGKQTITIDPKTRRITIEDANRFGTKKRLIAFNHIVDIHIGYLGKRSNKVTWYYLVLELNNGEEYPLFAPGRFFEGGSERATVEHWRQRLAGYLAEHHESTR